MDRTPGRSCGRDEQKSAYGPDGVQDLDEGCGHEQKLRAREGVVGSIDRTAHNSVRSRTRMRSLDQAPSQPITPRRGRQAQR